jgi:hypothetical protein
MSMIHTRSENVKSEPQCFLATLDVNCPTVFDLMMQNAQSYYIERDKRKAKDVSHEEIEDMKKLAHLGISYSKIAQIFKLTRYIVCKALLNDSESSVKTMPPETKISQRLQEKCN